MPEVLLPPINPDEQAELDNLFSYHKPFGSQPARYEIIRAKAKELAVLLLGACPRSADRTAAIRKLRECVMTANASIAINEKEPAFVPVPGDGEPQAPAHSIGAGPEQPAGEPSAAA